VQLADHESSVVGRIEPRRFEAVEQLRKLEQEVDPFRSGPSHLDGCGRVRRLESDHEVGAPEAPCS